MKSFMLFITLVSVLFTDKEPRFKYLDKATPLYLSIKGSPKDSYDAVTVFIKDSLEQRGFKIVSFEQHKERLIQMVKDMENNRKNMTQRDYKNKDDMFSKMFGGATNAQTLELMYVSGTDSSGNILSFDKIGFIHYKLPFTPADKPSPVFFSSKEIHSREAVAIARFIMGKM